MNFADIERLLGKDITQRVQDAIEDAGSVAGTQSSAREALRELLMAMLAAAIITPQEGAAERLEQAKQRLEEIVEVALQIGSPDQ
jgi:hypothetical protein